MVKKQFVQEFEEYVPASRPLVMSEVEKSSEYMAVDRKTRATAVKAARTKRSTRTPEKDDTVSMSMSMGRFSD